MAHEESPSEWEFPTLDGKKAKVTCPVCGSKQFVSLGPPDETSRKGFQHVIMGRTVAGNLLSLPVRSRHCANCGYILRFLLPNPPGKQEE
jgi:DNA-directed RNA polymerase subunit RPC12/RpoP